MLSYRVVYDEWASRENFVTIFGDLYQNKFWFNLNQFAHLSSAYSPSNDVIKMAVIVLLLYIVFQAIVEGELIARDDSLSLYN